MKSVQNVTTKHLELKAEILTVNGRVPISFRIAPGGHYFIEEALRYHNLEDLINSGSIKVLYEDSTLPVTTGDTEDKEPDIPVEVPAGEITSPDSVNSAVQETPSVESNDADEFVCPHCGATYATQRGLSRHMNSEHPHE